MSEIDALKNLKLDSARNRCRAHKRYLNCFSLGAHALPAVQHVVHILEKALEQLEKNLCDLGENTVLQYLNPDEIEATIHRNSMYLLPISTIIGLIEGAEPTAVPGELSAPLRAEICKQFPDAQLIIVAASELNYSIVEISAYLRELLHQLECDPLPDIPLKIFRIAIPKVEFDQALLHCILAHEIGHPLYRESDIEGKILPRISVSDQRIKDIYARLTASAESREQEDSQTELPFGELFFKNMVTRKVNTIIPAWIEELASDMFGLLIFGPAYLLATIHFASSIYLLNSTSESHPPTRFRLRILQDLMEKEFPSDKLGSNTCDFLRSWDEIVRREVMLEDLFEQLALEAIQEGDILDDLREAVLNCLPTDRRYTLRQYEDEVPELVSLIDGMIPPAERLVRDCYQSSTVPGILNAGWECFLGGLTGFKKCLPNADSISSFDLALKYNEFLIKSMELNQIRESWKRAKENAVVSGEN